MQIMDKIGAGGVHLKVMRLERLKAETVKLLQVIAAHLASLQNNVKIEGYTDARPYISSSGYSNWELSADRANSARRVLEEGGLRKDQILEVRGFADRNLKVPDKPLDFSNRRVSILLPLSQLDEEVAKPAARTSGTTQDLATAQPVTQSTVTTTKTAIQGDNGG